MTDWILRQESRTNSAYWTRITSGMMCPKKTAFALKASLPNRKHDDLLCSFDHRGNAPASLPVGGVRSMRTCFANKQQPAFPCKTTKKHDGGVGNRSTPKSRHVTPPTCSSAGATTGVQHGRASNGMQDQNGASLWSSESAVASRPPHSPISFFDRLSLAVG